MPKREVCLGNAVAYVVLGWVVIAAAVGAAACDGTPAADPALPDSPQAAFASVETEAFGPGGKRDGRESRAFARHAVVPSLSDWKPWTLADKRWVSPRSVPWKRRISV